jgi:hypothetical protein
MHKWDQCRVSGEAMAFDGRGEIHAISFAGSFNGQNQTQSAVLEATCPVDTQLIVEHA